MRHEWGKNMLYLWVCKENKMACAVVKRTMSNLI